MRANSVGSDSTCIKLVNSLLMWFKVRINLCKFYQSDAYAHIKRSMGSVKANKTRLKAARKFYDCRLGNKSRHVPFHQE